jgi:ADP-heptose:LPS heptosyltransferase
VPPEDDEYTACLLKDGKVAEPIVVVNPGAKSHLKRWTDEGFAFVSDKLIEESNAHIVFIGIDEDKDIVDKVIGRMKAKRNVHNFVNRTNIRQLADLLKRAKILITNDSAPLHLGCAVGAKVLALFGATDPRKYGPTGDLDVVITRKLHCSPCEVATCAYNYECMRLIPPEEVFEVAKLMVEGYEG